MPRVQGDDRRGRLRPDARSSRCSAGWSRSIAAGRFDRFRHPCLAAAEMGPHARAPRRAARDRARSQHAAAGAPARRASRGSARACPRCRAMPTRSRRSARPRSSSARRSRPGPIWSARRRRTICCGCRTRCRPLPFDDDPARDRARPRPAARASCSPSIDESRSAPPRSRRSTARSPPTGATVAVKVLRPGIEEDFAARDRHL